MAFGYVASVNTPIYYQANVEIYGVYDIVLKVTSNETDNLRSIITNKIRKIDRVQSTLTMMVIEEQENL